MIVIEKRKNQHSWCGWCCAKLYTVGRRNTLLFKIMREKNAHRIIVRCRRNRVATNFWTGIYLLDEKKKKKIIIVAPTQDMKRLCSSSSSTSGKKK